MKTVREIAERLMDNQVVGPGEFLTEVLSAIIVDQIELISNVDDWMFALNDVVIAVQNRLLPPEEVREDLGEIEALGCQWKGL